MPQYKSFGGGRRPRAVDVNVIYPMVRRSSSRMAKAAFLVTVFVVGGLAALIASNRTQPVSALLVGVLVGVLVGLPVFVVVWAWPVLRIVLHWWAELVLSLLVLLGVDALGRVLPGPVAVGLVLVVVAVVGLVRPVRGYASSVVWCLIARHRLRMSFAAFIRGNREGTLPLILGAVPTPVGERVWVWLRPGLSLAELRDRGDQLAVACWARDVEVTGASKRFAGLLRFDIRRRDTLAAPVDSPLVDVPDAPPRPVNTTPDGRALNMTRRHRSRRHTGRCPPDQASGGGTENRDRGVSPGARGRVRQR